VCYCEKCLQRCSGQITHVTNRLIYIMVGIISSDISTIRLFNLLSIGTAHIVIVLVSKAARGYSTDVTEDYRRCIRGHCDVHFI